FFFFQAEDGIRDGHVTGVQTCALPISLDLVFAATPEEELIDRAIEKRIRLRGRPQTSAETKKLFDHLLRQGFAFELIREKLRARSEERRVGKECGCRWWWYHVRKKVG